MRKLLFYSSLAQLVKDREETKKAIAQAAKDVFMKRHGLITLLFVYRHSGSLFIGMNWLTGVVAYWPSVLTSPSEYQVALLTGPA